MRMLATVAMAALLVLAGCSGAAPDDTPTPTPEGDVGALEETDAPETVIVTRTVVVTPTPSPTATPGPYDRATPAEPGVLYEGQTDDIRQFFEVEENATLVVEIGDVPGAEGVDFHWTHEGKGPDSRYFESSGTYRVDLTPETWGYRIVSKGGPVNVTVTLESAG